MAACILGNLLLRVGSAGALGVIALYLGHLDRTGSAVPATFLGFLAVAFYTSEFIGAPFFGALADTYGKRPFLLLGGILGAGAILPLSLLPALPVFVIAKTIAGLSSASSVPAVLSYLAAVTAATPSLRGRVMAAFEVATIVGFALGFALGGILWDFLQARAFYCITLVFLLAAAVFSRIQGEEIKTKSNRGWAAYRLLLRHKGTLGFMPAWLAVNAILGTWFTHLSFQMAKGQNPDQLLAGGYSGTTIGLVTAGIALVIVAGTAAWTPAFGRIRPTTIMSIGVVALGACALCLYWLNHTPRDFSSMTTISASGAMLALLVASGFTPAALAHLAELSERFPQERGSMMGLYSMLLGLGQLSGGWFGGFFAEAWAVDGLIFLTVLLGATAGGGLLLANRTYTSRPTSVTQT